MVTGLATLGAVALTAAPASAHTAEVHGIAECVDGQYVVAWTVTNDDKDHDAKLDVSVLPEKSKLTLVDKLKAGETVTGTQILPMGSRGIKNAAGEHVARIAIHGVWDAGDQVLTNDATADVRLPGTSCGASTPPPSTDKASTAKPNSETTLTCDDFQIDLTNPTKRPVRFTVAFQFDRHKVVYDDFLVRPGKTLTIPDDVLSGDESGKNAANKFNQSGDDEFSKLAVTVAVRKTQLATAEIDYSDCKESPSPSPSESQAVSASPSPAVVLSPSVSPAADSSLPVTGASLGGLLAGAALVLGLGTLMVVSTRRRKRS
jgi:hypothetical protein